MTNNPRKPPGTPDVDLTEFGNSGTINDAVFTTGLNHWGIFNPFLQIKHNGTEQGYNTNSTHEQFNEGESKLFNHALLLANVPIVIGDGTRGTAEGVAYRQFLLNISEADGSKQFLSLDKLQIWQEESGSLSNFSYGHGFAGAHTNYLAYDLDAGGDHWIGLGDDLNRPLAQTDFEVLIPDSLFINDTAHRYVTLYSGFGYHNGWTADGGFEEWGVSTLFLPGTTAAMSMKKTASVPGGTADHAGEIITYSFELYNVGDRKLTGITMTDASVSDLARGADIVGNNDNNLDVGETWSFTAHHTVTQSEMDSNGGGTGQITNTATADSNQTGPVSASTSIEIVQGSHAVLVKLASVLDGTADAAGDLISYAFALTNDGVTTLTNPVVTDSMITSQTPILNGSAPIVNPNAQIFVPVLDGDFNLGDTNQNGVADAGETFQFVYPGDITNDGIHDPGETWSAINLGDANNDGIHQVGETWVGDTNQNGVEDAGERWQFKNLGDTNHNNLQDAGETWHYLNVGDTNQNGVQDPGETFQYFNVGDTNRNGFQDAGETFQFYNAGDTNQNGVEDPGETFQFVVSHDVAGVDTNNDGFNDGDANHDGVLNVGETWQFAFTHTLTQAEIDNGGIVDPGLTIDNTATASTNQVVSIATASASVPVQQNPHVVLAKDATVPGGTADAAGEVISYTIVVTNDGNMTLTDPAVSDPFVSNLAAVTSGGFNSGDTDHDGKLDLGETWHYTANHTVSQAEMDAGGSIANTASVSTDQGATASDGASVTVQQNPHLTLEKNGIWGDADADGFADLGEQIHYRFRVTNDGNVTLHGVTLTDPQVAGVTRGVDVVGNNDAVFDVGETWSYTGSHTVGQGDIDAGHVHNTATAAALGPQNQAASDADDNDAALPQNTHLTLAKSGTWVDGSDGDGFADAGEQVDYSFLVTNDGNVTLHGVTITDPQVTGLARGADVTGNNDAVFDVGEVWSYTASHTLIQADVDAGTLHNSATADALGPQDQAANGNASSDVTLPQPPPPPLTLDMSLSMWIDANGNGHGDFGGGDLIQFGFTLTNHSGDTLHGFTVSDTLGAAAGTLQSQPPASLAPNDNWPSTYNYFLNATDAANHHVSDTLTITALDSQNHTLSVTAFWDQVFPV